MPPGLDAGGWETARAGPVHSSHASPLALSPASVHASVPLYALPERNLIGVAGELRTLTKVRISPGLAAASKTRQIDDASVCCAPRHACLSEDSPSQDMVPPACPDASSSMRGNGQGTHSSWSLAPRSVAVVHSKTWEQSQRLAVSSRPTSPLPHAARYRSGSVLLGVGVVGTWAQRRLHMGTAARAPVRSVSSRSCYPTPPPRNER